MDNWREWPIDKIMALMKTDIDKIEDVELLRFLLKMTITNNNTVKGIERVKLIYPKLLAGETRRASIIAKYDEINELARAGTIQVHAADAVGISDDQLRNTLKKEGVKWSELKSGAKKLTHKPVNELRPSEVTKKKCD